MLGDYRLSDLSQEEYELAVLLPNYEIEHIVVESNELEEEGYAQIMVIGAFFGMELFQLVMSEKDEVFHTRRWNNSDDLEIIDQATGC